MRSEMPILPGVRAHGRLLGLDGVGERADRPEVGRAQLAAQARVAQDGARVVAQRQQHVVLEVVEAAVAVGAHEHPVELVVDVDGQGYEVLDLGVGALGVLGGAVVAKRLVAFQGAGAEALHEV